MRGLQVLTRGAVLPFQNDEKSVDWEEDAVRGCFHPLRGTSNFLGIESRHHDDERSALLAIRFHPDAAMIAIYNGLDNC